MLIDTHSHIHDKQYNFDLEKVFTDAEQVGVEKIFCIGTNASDSKAAIEFVSNKPQCVASIGLHPHDASQHATEIVKLKQLAKQKRAIAVGECGLDYFYKNSKKSDQHAALHSQIKLAKASNLPMIFHVREAFGDFWKIIDEYKDIKGVIHSFTGTRQELDNALARGLHIAINGIITFTKNDWQLDAARAIPLNRLLLETDAPFLTPIPYRGKVNVPANVKLVAEFLANLRGEEQSLLANTTSTNAKKLFKL